MKAPAAAFDDPQAAQAMRRLRWGAWVLALAVALGWPLNHGYQTTAAVMKTLRTEASLLSDELSAAVSRSPEVWRYERSVLRRMIEAAVRHEGSYADRGDVAQGARLFDSEGRLLLAVGRWQADSPLVVTRMVLDSGAEVARLELQAALAPVVAQVALVTLAALLLAAGLLLLIHRVALASIAEDRKSVV